ncbi:MAG: putative DNA binding domain-containing protein [Chloroflexi bacterium]|nr:putative DNA binding domain-containing protein [Chloroflexota bacterium]
MRTAVAKGLDIAAITDHNTVAGVGAIRREVEWLTRLEKDGRLTETERAQLAEWRELAGKVLLLPGFEFTATFGFHILAIFPPETSLRHLEHVLLTLKVPADKLDVGSTETGASTEVLSAYRIIREAGGLVIAAHANSTHGVAMRNFPFGGQTKIAYTQDVNLDALEVTDLEGRRYSSARFFNGSKTEYPRRMHSIQGSDAHRLHVDAKNVKRLGIGERATEMLLDAPTFEGIKALLQSTQFERTRPARPKDIPFDALMVARAEGPSIVQSFHESASQRGGKLAAILYDVCAFANTAGGTIFVGAGATQRKDKAKGLENPKAVEAEILAGLQERLTPPLEVKIDTIQSEDIQLLRLRVPKGADRPYCLDDNKFYVRDESDTSLAVRDEIVALVREVLEASTATKRPPARNENGSGENRAKSENRDRYNRRDRGRTAEELPEIAAVNGKVQEPELPLIPVTSNGEDELGQRDEAFYLPQIGVEIVETGERNGNRFYSVRDLRNGHIIKNVTRRGARKLWNYAIQQHEDRPAPSHKIEWRGNIGLVGLEKRAGKTRYDLALREGDRIRIFYGVTDDGMEGEWASFVQEE